MDTSILQQQTQQTEQTEQTQQTQQTQTKLPIANKMIKIKASSDFEVNGRIYFIPDKYMNDTIIHLGCEFQELYKIMIALYLDLQISNNKITNISKITKSHLMDSLISSNKLISYITTGSIYISHLTSIEKQIIEKIPEYLINIINPRCIEKLDL